MVQSPKVSIIVPVYNVEKYLEESLNCIVNQTFEDFEVICVDDGSTDRSLGIIKRYVERDNRFKVICQKNAGGGAARNNGFLEAKGEYVIFLDSDDLFSPKLLEKAYEEAVNSDADIVAFNFRQFDETGTKNFRWGVHIDWLPQNVNVFNYKDCPDLILSIVNPTPWNKLYRSEFIKKFNLKFDEISSSNDITYAAVSVACAGKIAYLKAALVEYRIGHAGTITSTKT